MLLGAALPPGRGAGDIAGQVQSGVDQADVGVGLGKVAKLAVGDRVEHLGKQAQVVRPVSDHLVEVVESAVGLAGVDEVPYQPEA